MDWGHKLSLGRLYIIIAILSQKITWHDKIYTTQPPNDTRPIFDDLTESSPLSPMGNLWQSLGRLGDMVFAV